MLAHIFDSAVGSFRALWSVLVGLVEEILVHPWSMRSGGTVRVLGGTIRGPWPCLEGVGVFLRRPPLFFWLKNEYVFVPKGEPVWTR